jgi:hypothetical protein
MMLVYTGCVSALRMSGRDSICTVSYCAVLCCAASAVPTQDVQHCGAPVVGMCDGPSAGYIDCICIALPPAVTAARAEHWLVCCYAPWPLLRLALQGITLTVAAVMANWSRRPAVCWMAPCIAFANEGMVSQESIVAV